MASVKLLEFEASILKNFSLGVASGRFSSNSPYAGLFLVSSTEVFEKDFVFIQGNLDDISIYDFFGLDSFLSNHKSDSVFWECQDCGKQMILKSPNLADKSYYLGLKFNSISANLPDILNLSINLGINRIFFEGVGFVDVSDNRLKYYFDELLDTENAFLVLDFFSGDFEKIIQFKSRCTKFPIEVFSVFEKQINRDLTFVFECSSCKSEVEILNGTYRSNDLAGTELFPLLDAESNFDKKKLRYEIISKLEEFLTKNGRSLSEKGYKLLNFVNILNSIGLGKLCLSDQLDNLSIQQIYAAKLLSKTVFDESRAVYLYRFPVLEEFPELVVKDFITSAYNSPDILISSKVRLGKNEVESEFSKMSNYTCIDSIDSLFSSLESDYKIIQSEEFISIRMKKDLNEKLGNSFRCFNALDYFSDGDRKSVSSIYTALGFADYFSKLYSQHSLSLSRGYGNQEFLYTKSSFVCRACGGRAEGTDLSEIICQVCEGQRFTDILSPIKWLGFSIGDLMLEPLNSVVSHFKVLIPLLRNMSELLECSPLKDAAMGLNVSRLEPIQKFCLQLVKYRFQELKVGDVVFVESVEAFLNDSRFLKFFKLFMQDLGNAGCKVILRSCK